MKKSARMSVAIRFVPTMLYCWMPAFICDLTSAMRSVMSVSSFATAMMTPSWPNRPNFSDGPYIGQSL